MKLNKKKLAIFCSGGGSNFRALYTNIHQLNLPFEIVMCLSNNSKSGAMEFAQQNNIDTVHLSSITVSSEQEFSEKMIKACETRQVDYILLAGYMKQIPKKVIEKYPKRILNIHPSLLPKFGGEGMYGMAVHEAVIRSAEKESGATVHYVSENYDEGEIILQKKISVLPSDTPTTLAEKVLKIEHELYTEALSKIFNQEDQIGTHV